jgi:hypothetical protein
MSLDLAKTSAFMHTHARVLDRRRFDYGLGRINASDLLAGLAAYRNPDGGYGWGLEPDLRSTTSQPVAALHAFEVWEEVSPACSPVAAELCDWLDSVSLPDGGLPFALPIPDPEGCAPFFVNVDPSQSALHMTAAVAVAAHRVAHHDAAVREHRWLARVTGYCRREIAAMTQRGAAYEFRYVLQFLDATIDDDGAADELKRLGAWLPASGELPVEGGIEGEYLHPIDISPRPGRPLRDVIAPEVIQADLDRLAAAQQGDGGWPVGWQPYSPAAALEWRGYLTVQAVQLLRVNAR